jgi:hypothetical protein
LANLSVGLEKKKLKMFASKKRGKESNEIILKAKAKKMCHVKVKREDRGKYVDVIFK